MLEENSQCCKGFPTECCDCKEKCALEEYVSVDALKQKLHELNSQVDDELKRLGDEVDRGCWSPLNIWDLFFAIKTFMDTKVNEVLGLLEKKILGGEQQK